MATKEDLKGGISFKDFSLLSTLAKKFVILEGPLPPKESLKTSAEFRTFLRTPIVHVATQKSWKKFSIANGQVQCERHKKPSLNHHHHHWSNKYFVCLGSTWQPASPKWRDFKTFLCLEESVSTARALAKTQF